MKTAAEKKRYYPQHMHIHSIYEPGASMEGHIYFAKMQGIKHMWFTEHDVLWNKKTYKLSFEADELVPGKDGVPTQPRAVRCVQKIRISMMERLALDLRQTKTIRIAGSALLP